MTHRPDTSLPTAAAATAAEHAMLPACAPVVAMVSGGADSVALLHLLAREELGLHPVLVLHVNHLLRGDDAETDEAFVRALADRLGVASRVVRYDVAAYSNAEGLNLEDAGRRVRYQFAEEELDIWCAAHDVAPHEGRIAVAHTLDDRIETFFMRALFGAGTGGLASIRPVRGRIVRPLIETERTAVQAYLRELGEEWREDATNTDTARLRAAVRVTLLPVAEEISPSFRRSLARSMDLLAADDALLDSQAESLVSSMARIVPGVEVFIDRTALTSHDPAMARRIVKMAVVRAFPDASRLERAHIDSMAAGGVENDYARDLPGGIRAHAEYGKLRVCRADVELPTVAPGLLLIPGSVDLGEAGRLSAVPVEPVPPVLDVAGGAEEIVIDADRIDSELTIDGPRPGDRMRPLGMKGSRKLSDLLVDAKVPRRQRMATPVVRDGNRVVWLAGVRMSDEYRVSGETKRCVRLTWERTSE